MYMNKPPYCILIQSWLATLGSLYYGWYWDPVINYRLNDWFNSLHGFTPCEMCWFARIFMYPILALIILYYYNKDERLVDPILLFSFLGVIQEWYQYRFQMSNSTETIKAVICDPVNKVSCAATDVMYRGFVTIPFMALLAFVVIFVSALIWKSHNDPKRQ